MNQQTLPSQRREVLLLNLKWFVNRLVKCFETRLNEIADLAAGNRSGLHSSPRHLTPCREKALLSSPILKHFSLPGTPKRSRGIYHTPRRQPNLADSRLLHLRSSTTDTERVKLIHKFASHLCLVYEYQLGMLKGYKSVKAVVDFVTEVIIRALRSGVIDDLRSESGLHPGLLFDIDLHPTSGELWVKTSGIGIHQDSLSWRISDLFTHPGLRYNQVIGQGCHNLSIVTHFLAPYSTNIGLNYKFSELYGYRNLILLPAQRPSISPTGDCPPKLGSETEDDTDMGLQYMRMFPQDVATIKHNKISSNPPTPGSESTTPDQTPSPQPPPDTLLVHIHKSYQPIFFLLYDRAEVMDHLIECDTFARFCTTHKLTSVMFVNRYVDGLAKQTADQYFHNFDVFKVSASQFIPAVKDKVKSLSSSSPFNSPKKVLDTQMIISAYDNPAFLT